MRLIKLNIITSKHKYKEIDKNLLRGPAPSIKDLINLKKQNVSQIYDFRHRCFRGMKFVEAIACKILGIKYKRLPFSFLKGKLPTLKDYESVSKSIYINGKNNHKTLLHCNSGRHRTGQMVAFYYLTKGMSLKECQKRYNKTYTMRMNSVIKKHLDESGYFNRKTVDNKTKNPIKYLFNRFNNRVAIETKNAYDYFINLLNK